MRRIGLTIAAVWLALGALNAGFMNASLEHQGYYRCAQYRDELAFAVGWSLFSGPAGVLLAPFMTGFYENGWRLAPRVDCQQVSHK